MNAKNIKHLFHCTLAALLLGVFAGPAAADDNDRKRVKIEGTATGMFVQNEGLGLSQGRFVSSVDLAGTFSIWAGDMLRTGRFTFAHLLVANLDFPPGEDPVFLSGDATGAIVLFFDDFVVCDGALAGDFDETGFNLLAKGKLECTDGTKIRLKMRDVTVRPSDTVEFDIKGRLITPGHDDD